MIKDAIDSFFAGILAKVGDAWSGLWAPISDAWPLWWSYGVFALILLGCLLVGFFLQFKWARLALGVVVLTAAGWLVGRTTMHSAMKAKLDAERARKTRNLPPPKPKPPVNDGRWNPFNKP